MRPREAVESLRRMAENPHTPPRKRQTFSDLADLMQELARDRKAYKLRVRGLVKGRQSLMLSGNPEQVAEVIADMAGDGRVMVTRVGSGVRVFRGDESDRRRRKIIGVYDAGCDVRDVMEDLAA